MQEDYELNRLEFMILDTMYDCGMTDYFHSITISELIAKNEGVLGARMTIYRKMQKLVKNGYVKKGCLDNHADTFYLLEKSIKLFEGGQE